MANIQAGGYSPTVKKRALSRKLLEIRRQCGLTTAEVVKQLGWSHTKLNYIEKAKWVDPSSDAIADLCEVYGVEGADRDALIRLAREARQRGWWRKYNDIFNSELPGFEAGASKIRTFENTVIPGLLQVPSYIETVSRAVGRSDAAEIERRVEARTERQKILTRKKGSCRLHAVIDGNAILRISKPEVRKLQIQHLLDMDLRRNVTIQVIPLTAGIYAGAGETYLHMEFPEPGDRDIVYVETAYDSRLLEETDELERYMVRFDRLCAAALTPAATRDYLQSRLSESHESDPGALA